MARTTRTEEELRPGTALAEAAGPHEAGARDGDPGPAPRREPGAVRARLLAVATTVLVIAALKWMRPVALPVAFGIFLVAVAWPLEARLSRRMPRWAGLALTVLLFLAVFALFGAALYWSGRQIAEASPRYAGEVRGLWEGLRGRLAGYGLDLPARPGGAGGSGGGGASTALKYGAAALWGGIGTLLLAFTVMVLGLIEVPAFQRKARRALPGGGGERLADAAERICSRYERYVLARTLSSLLNGAVVGLFCLALGIDLAFVWGLSAFLLNFIPTLGSALAVLPPSLFALVQFGAGGKAAAVFAALAVIQLVLGNYVEPWIEGHYTALSPAVVLVSMVFWGWVWGILGTLISVPLTAGIAIGCSEFERTRWIAVLLSGQGDGENPAGGARRRPA